jgi:peptide/nickel transport system permease protein
MPDGRDVATAQDVAADAEVPARKGSGAGTTTGTFAAEEAISPAEPLGAAERALSTRQLAWRRFRRHKLAMISAGVLILLALVAIFAKFITPYTFRGTINDLASAYQGPSAKHWFGTDELGRDEFTRVIYGGRISLMVGLSVALVAGFVGAVVGGIAGYYGGWLDNVMMRVTDLFLSIPFLVILIIASQALGTSTWDIVVILSLFFWMGDARIVRGMFLSLKEKEFVEAARASGARDRRIIFYHILPNVTGPIVVNLTLLVAAAILTESALSFLGFGIQPPTPSWGNLLSNAQNQVFTAPWLIYFPGLFILITVLCVNFLGDGLRDALDPHGKITEAV